MRALQLTAPGQIALRDVPVPEIGSSEVLVKVAGAGLCHSDLHILHLPKPLFDLPITLGHETAGRVAAMGDAVRGLAEGDAVLVCLVWGCGTCRPCVEGRDNVCANTGGRLGSPPAPGFGPDGGMAEYIKADARHLERLGSLDPRDAGPLTDAALTPMHAINGARHRLTPGSTAVVIGIGGLGHMAVQILRYTSATRIIAVDTDRVRLEWALAHGADDAVFSDESAAERILDVVGGYGVDATFDFVGAPATLDLASRVIAPDGALRVIGIGTGRLTFGPIGVSHLPRGVELRHSYGGTRADLRRVIEMASLGRIRVETERYPLDDALEAFADLEAGRIAGRAILVP